MNARHILKLIGAICWWISRGHDGPFALKSSLDIWLIYTVIDLAVVFSAGMTSRLAVFVVISTLTKLGAAWLGGRVGSVGRLKLSTEKA